MAGAANPQLYARLAGGGYVLIFLLALSANFAALGAIIERGDPSATAANLAALEPMFRLAIVAFMLVLVADVVIGWALYLLLRPAGAGLSLLVLLFRMVYTAAQIGVLLVLVHALRIGIEGIAFGGQPEALRDALAYYFLRAHGSGFSTTLVFFGAHLILLGILVARARFLPRLIGWLVILAGAGYVIDGLAWIGWSGYGDLPGWVPMVIVFLPAVIGEASLGLWLLIRGVDREVWAERAAIVG